MFYFTWVNINNTSESQFVLTNFTDSSTCASFTCDAHTVTTLSANDVMVTNFQILTQP